MQLASPGHQKASTIDGRQDDAFGLHIRSENLSQYSYTGPPIMNVMQV